MAMLLFGVIVFFEKKDGLHFVFGHKNKALCVGFVF